MAAGLGQHVQPARAPVFHREYSFGIGRCGPDGRVWGLVVPKENRASAFDACAHDTRAVLRRRVLEFFFQRADVYE
ncbi:hypothetical protein D3C85_1852790 [compost metagenome]